MKKKISTLLKGHHMYNMYNNTSEGLWDKK